MIMAHSNASFLVPIRAGTSSRRSARRPSQRGVGNTKVPAALKSQPARDPNPMLGCNSPLCCGHSAGVFHQGLTCVPMRFFADPPGRGVRVRLGSDESSLGGQGGGTSTHHPLDPWHLLQINVFWKCSMEVYGLVALGHGSAHPPANTRKWPPVEAPIFFCGR